LTALGERGRVFDPLPHHTLRAIGQDADPAGLPVPLLLSGVTDGRFFARLGIQTYGFLPLNLPPGFDFTRLIHAADERLPVAALDFGTRAIAETLRRFGEATTP
jgi:acetylornithine deacetylase/succinyl-diaminopimelate desuccinylase-like protein